MRNLRRFLWQASPWRALAEAWLACLLLLIPMFPVLIDAHPLPRSLYLILLPLGCAILAGLRMRFPSRSRWRALGLELAAGFDLGVGLTGLVFGLFALFGQLDVLRLSSTRYEGTAFFLFFAALEFLGLRLLIWLGHSWDRLRRRRYVWGLTHASLVVVGALGVVGLIGALVYLAYFFRGDIWGISPDSVFAQVVFWLAMMLIVALALATIGILLFLPPSLLFSFIAARQMTGRVESLANGARALRQGNLAARVAVQGEDEIAQLQADFNAMAGDFETSVADLEAEKEKVIALLDARSDLVAGISHELRNPAAVILGYSESLSREYQALVPTEVRAGLEMIQAEASRLQAILNDLLTLSQVEAGRLQVTLEKTCVILLAQRVVETLAPLAWSGRKVQVSLYAPNRELTALADPLRLEQVLINLVQNAVRHTSPGGLVALAIGQENGSIWIEVEDTGEGISAADLEHIWERYYRAGSTNRGNGAGLGLAMVKELCEAMGGSAVVKSVLGEGSVFKVVLQAAAVEK